MFGGGGKRTPTGSGSSSIGKDDLVAVIGASGNVGRLVALGLADKGSCKVRAIARNAQRANEFFKGGVGDEIEVVEADTTDPASLAAALVGCSGVVIVTGTTAFPTLAWRGGNTPKAVDAQGVKNVLAAWREVAGVPCKRAVLMSSVGVTRRKSFPFVVLNAAGVLDAKAEGEAALRAACGEAEGEGGWLGGYSVVRPGQLIGGPYDNNYYLGTLAKLDRPARSILLWDDSEKANVEVGSGDTLLGDTLRSTVAAVCVRALLDSACSQDFAVINTDGPAPSEAELGQRMSALA